MQYPKLSVRMIKAFRSPATIALPDTGSLSLGYCMRTYTKVKRDTALLLKVLGETNTL